MQLCCPYSALAFLLCNPRTPPVSLFSLNQVTVSCIASANGVNLKPGR